MNKKLLTEIQMNVIKKATIKVTEINKDLKDLEAMADKLKDKKTKLLEIITYTRGNNGI